MKNNKKEGISAGFLAILILGSVFYLFNARNKSTENNNASGNSRAKEVSQASHTETRECELVSSRPEDWRNYKVGPKSDVIFSKTIEFTSYIFVSSPDHGPCVKNCPYKLPSFDGDVASVNKVLGVIGLPEVSKIFPGGKREYTAEDYPLGKLSINVSWFLENEERCSRHIWKISISREH
ncbi:hypothetical protein [uncultured Thiodictyon sp.]|uniref:hypothetical protein n=1 Tax=uncultured Thiodictyon sp. TaxID=1846217 RepID=UPI0025F6BFC1|nr:hypothetical protein [uncultured Thiodictyon sp.]